MSAPSADIALLKQLLDRLSLVGDAAAKEALRERIAQAKGPFIVSFLNAHALNLAACDPVFADRLAASDLLLRDGIGLALLLRLLGRAPGINMNGTDFIPEILSLFAGRAIALIGTQEPWLSAAARQVEAGGGAVALREDGFQTPAHYGQSLAAARPALTILAMGMPKQEEIAAYLKRAGLEGGMIVNGGAILDFMAGRFPRAPQAWRRLHMEWLFRLILEPRRLFARYVSGGMAFLLLVLRLRANGKGWGC